MLRKLLIGVAVRDRGPLGAAKVAHDPLGDRLAREGELFGLPVTGLKTKRYALGLVPIGDAFLAWSRSARPLVADEQPELDSGPGWWRVPWLLLLWVPPLIVWSLVRLRGPRRRH